MDGTRIDVSCLSVAIIRDKGWAAHLAHPTSVNMYSLVLTLHSWLRWAILVTVVIGLVRSVLGWLGEKDWGFSDTRVARVVVSLIDTQILFGLVMYVFLSPITHAAFDDFRAAMKNAPIRYFAVEHGVTALLTAAVAHIGSVKARRAANGALSHRNFSIAMGVCLLLLLATIPWPFLPYGRDLFRLP